MNRYNIEDAYDRHCGGPIGGGQTPIAHGARTLFNLCRWVDRNSDGWPYWRKPSQASRTLQDILQWAERARYRHDAAYTEPTAAEIRRAQAPIKAFRTRQAARLNQPPESLFEISEP